MVQLEIRSQRRSKTLHTRRDQCGPWIYQLAHERGHLEVISPASIERNESLRAVGKEYDIERCHVSLESQYRRNALSTEGICWLVVT